MPRDLQAGTRITILGGGTAGWITANALIARWARHGIEITVVESPDIATVGVGEGSTPQLKQFFESIGVAEADWMPGSQATYKNGITFADWTNKPGFESYYHPFPARTDEHTTGAFYFNALQRRRGENVPAHPDRFFLSARLAAERRGPIPNENFPFELEYGYHFDAGLLADFLKATAVARGVKHVEAAVVEVTRTVSGDIDALLTDKGESIGADFFVDCSGFSGVLLQKTLQVPFRSFADNLFNDAAVVLATPQVDDIGSQTVSTALKFGWYWEIPLRHRIGNGYVYSSSYCSADQAETELRESLGLLESDAQARHLTMKVGRVDRHWEKNCLAIGLSQGFIEPLEATALNIVCSTVNDFIVTAEERGLSGRGRASFNDRASERFERIRDYIVAHYVVSSRDDTEYWKDNSSNKNISDELRQILSLWHAGADLVQAFRRQQIVSAYGPMSWYCLLAGHGQFPDVDNTEPADHARVNIKDVDEFVRRCALNFRTQNEQLIF